MKNFPKEGEFNQTEYLISVVIPTKDREKIISKAIESVLAQQDVLIQVIVVNDGSNDGTSDLIQLKYPEVILINNKTSVGGAKARNIGSEVATGKFIAFLDSDDDWLPDHLLTQLKIIIEHEVDGVYGSFFLNENQKQKEIKFFNHFPPDFTIADKIASFAIHDARTSTFLFKKEKFMNVKFDERLTKHQDWDLAINFEKKYKLVLAEKPTTVIHVDPMHIRMSNSLKPEATRYFLEKNRKFFKNKNYYLFCIKMIMYAQAMKDKTNIPVYLNLIKTVLPQLGLKEKILVFAIEHGLINLNNLRRIKRVFY